MIDLTTAANVDLDACLGKITRRLLTEIPDLTLHMPDHHQQHCLEVMYRLYTLRATHDHRKEWTSETSAINFMDSLAEVRYLQSSDPRDSIFGFLGLAPKEITDLIKPKYESSIRNVYENATVQLIRVSESLWPFGLIRRMASSQFSTSSWVVDWSYLAPEDHRAWHWCSMMAQWQMNFRACGTRRLNYDHIEAGVMRLTGTSFSCVKETLIPDRKIYTEEAWLRKLYDEFAAKGHEPHSPRYVTGGCQLDALWKTLVYDIEWKVDRGVFGRCSNEETCQFQQWLSSLPCSASVDSPDPPHARTGMFRIASNHRTFFTTDDGYIGMGPAELEQGDYLFILGGGAMVYALRPTDQQDTFTLVGDCYVHGVMDGELAPASTEDMQHVLLV